MPNPNDPPTMGDDREQFIEEVRKFVSGYRTNGGLGIVPGNLIRSRVPIDPLGNPVEGDTRTNATPKEPIYGTR